MSEAPTATAAHTNELTAPSRRVGEENIERCGA